MIKKAGVERVRHLHRDGAPSLLEHAANSFRWHMSRNRETSTEHDDRLLKRRENLKAVAGLLALAVCTNVASGKIVEWASPSAQSVDYAKSMLGFESDEESGVASTAAIDYAQGQEVRTVRVIGNDVKLVVDCVGQPSVLPTSFTTLAGDSYNLSIECAETPVS